MLVTHGDNIDFILPEFVFHASWETYHNMELYGAIYCFNGLARMELLVCSYLCLSPLCIPRVPEEHMLNLSD